MTEKELMLSGMLYRQSEELRKEFQRARKLTRLLNTSTEEERERRIELVKELFGKTGDYVWVEPPFHCDYGRQIFVGESFYANFDCVILDECPVTIGDEVMFGPRVCVYTAGHPIDAEVRDAGLEYGKPVTIGNSVWIGGNTVINPGVTIGDDVVIGSGSVVTKDIPSHVIAAGNPCRVIRAITEQDREYWKEQERLSRESCEE